MVELTLAVPVQPGHHEGAGREPREVVEVGQVTRHPLSPQTDVGH